MQIGNSNFYELHDVVETLLRNCEYFAVDLEFSGLEKDTDDGQAEKSGKDASSPDDGVAAVLAGALSTPQQVYNRKRASPAYSVMQIGISIFERVPVMERTTGRDANTHACEAASATQVDENGASATMLSTVVEYMTNSAKTLIALYGSHTQREHAAGHGATSPLCWTPAQTANVVLDDILSVRQQAQLPPGADLRQYVRDLLRDIGSHAQAFRTHLGELSGSATAGGDADSARAPHGEAPAAVVGTLRAMESLSDALQLYAQWMSEIPSLVELLEQQQQQQQQQRRQQREPHDNPSASRVYRPRTFYAYLFPSPASVAFEKSAIQAVTVGEFLRDNSMDFNKWVHEGLRFATLAEYSAYKIEAMRNSGKYFGAASDPHQCVPQFTDVFRDSLDALLPLTDDELRYARFVIGLHEGGTRAEVARHTAKCFLYSRQVLLRAAGGVVPTGESQLDAAGSGMAPPPSAYIASNDDNKREASLLFALGLQKTNKRFEASGASGNGSHNGAASGGDGGGSGERAWTNCFGLSGTGRSGNGSNDAHYFGSKLMTTLLTATQQWGKPMILHNGFSDLAMLVRTLYGTLPENYADFKRLCRDMFPTLYDTRAITCAPVLQDVRSLRGKLESTFRQLNARAMRAQNVKGYSWLLDARTAPQFVFDSGLAGSVNPCLSDAIRAHNAGYDAYLTGTLFALARGELLSRARAISGAHTLESATEPLEGIVPVYGSVLSINFRTVRGPAGGHGDLITQHPNAPVAYVYNVSVAWFMDKLISAAARESRLQLSVMFQGSGYLVFVCNPDLPEDGGEEGWRRLMAVITSMRRDVNGAQSLTVVRVAYEPLLDDKANGLRFLERP